MIKIRRERNTKATRIWGSLLSAGIGYLSQKGTNRENTKNFQTNLAFQRENAQNAHQWETQDLEKAGLNRILGYSKGSGGAKPSGGSGLPEIKNPAGAGLTTALGQAQIKLTDAQTNKANAEAENISNIQSTTGNVRKIADQVTRVIDSMSSSFEPEKLQEVKEQLPIDAKKLIDKIINKANQAKRITSGVKDKIKEDILQIIYHYKTFIEKGVNPDKINYQDKKGRHHQYSTITDKQRKF